MVTLHMRLIVAFRLPLLGIEVRAEALVYKSLKYLVAILSMV